MKMRSMARHGGALALLCLTAGAAWSAAPAQSTVVRYELTISQGKKRPIQITRTIWKKGDRYRIEVKTAEGTQITVGGPSGAFVMAPGSQVATKVPRVAGGESGFWSALFGDAAAMRKGKKLGGETLAGRKTEAYAQKLDGPKTGVAPGVKGTMHVWLAPGLPMPFKAVTTMERGMKSVLALKSIQLGGEIPDSLLDVPKGVSVAPPQMLPGMIPADKVPKAAWFRNQ